MSTALTSTLRAGGARAGALRADRPPVGLSEWLQWLRVRLAAAADLAQTPLVGVLRRSCPECAYDSPGARLYPFSLAAAFAWIAFFSTLISAVVSRWGQLLGVPPSFLGMCVIAIGAEIPDMIQSVAVARRGYGSMAVSNSAGSQIINILIGLGLPWLLSNLAGHEIEIGEIGEIRLMALFQVANVSLFVSLLLLTTWRSWRRGDHSKAQLGKRKGCLLLAAYFVSVGGFALHLFLSQGADQGADEA